MTDTPSFQDLLNDFADEVFVGRSEQLSLFENGIKATKPAFLILNIAGQGGVGKSTLLERYRGISKSNDVAYAIVNEDHLTIPKILETFVEQLEKDGLDFSHFNERYRKYQELKEKVEADPKVPSGLMDFALRGITKVGMKSLKRIPVAGDVADVFLTKESEDVVAEQVSEFSKYIFQKFTNKDERVLLLEKDSELTKYFLEDLTKTLTTRKAILSFDTYEKTSENIEKWLIDLILGEFGQFSSNIRFVIAGRYALGQNWTRLRSATRQVELKEFTEEEAKDYLTRSRITDEKLISQFIEVTEGLPVLLALLVSSPNQLPHSVSGDAVQRFLQGLTPEQQEAALISSLPRFFNGDILAAVLGVEEGKKAFEWLSRSHFVRTSENGWVYHDVVRMMMLKYFRMRSGQEFVERHKLLEQYYEIRIADLGLDSNVQKITDTSSKHEKEKNYHFLCQNPSKNMEILVKNLAGTLWVLWGVMIESPKIEESTKHAIELLKRACSNPLGQLNDEFSDMLTKEQMEDIKNLAKLLSGESIKPYSKLYEWLINLDNLTDQEKSALYILRVHSVSGEEKRTYAAVLLADLNKVVQINPTSVVGYYFRSQYLLADEQNELALADLSKLVELQPANEMSYFRRGFASIKKNNFAALADFNKAIELQPESLDSYFMRGLTYFVLEDYLPALADFTKTIEFQPEKGDYYFMRGQVYHAMKDYPAAVTNYAKAIELLHDIVGNYSARAKSYYEMQNYPAVLDDIAKIMELAPENHYAYYQRGQVYHALGDYSAALVDLTKAIELKPDDADYSYERGNVYLAMSDYSAALVDLTKAIELRSENWIFRIIRGVTHFKMENYPLALVDITKSIELLSGNELGTIYRFRSKTFLKMGDYPSALEDVNKAIEMEFTGENYFLRGEIYNEMKELTAAITDLTKAIELQPDDDEYYRERGKAYSDMGNHIAALDDFSKAIELEPRSAANHIMRGTVYRRLGDHINALADYTKASELVPEQQGWIYEFQGKEHFSLKNYFSALTDFSRAIELQPEDGTNYYWRGSTYYAMEDYPSAHSDFTKAIELQPEDGDSYYWRGRASYQIKDFSASISDFSKAIELKPGFGYSYYRRALCQGLMGNRDSYIEDAKVAFQLFDDEYKKKQKPNIAFMMALCLIADEDVEKARKLYEVTINQCSEKEDLARALENLEELIEIIGKTSDTESIVKLLNAALAKLS